MRRWATISEFVTSDHERLQHITIHAADDNKQSVKRENKGYNHTRLLLVPENKRSCGSYSIAKMSRI